MVLLALLTISILVQRGRFDIKRITSYNEAVRNTKVTVGIYLNTAIPSLCIATFGLAFLRSSVYTTGMPLSAYSTVGLTVFDVTIMLTIGFHCQPGKLVYSDRFTQICGMQKPLFGAILLSAVLLLSFHLPQQRFNYLLS
jgi:hypothetical protein